MTPSNQLSLLSRNRQAASIPKQLFAIAVASFAAIAANVLLYLLLKHLFGVEFVAPEASPPPELSPLPVTDVVIFSIVFCIGASMVFLIVANTTRRPATIFGWISLVVLFVSLYLPLRIPTPPVPMETKLALASMHIFGAGVLVPLLFGIGLVKKSRRP